MSEEAAEIGTCIRHDIESILSSPGRDYLIGNNGDQVKICNLKGKTIGLYFAASWCGPCRHFTPNLIDVYNELSPQGKFEIILVSEDDDEDSFNSYFCKMPWLAFPFIDSERIDRLDELFKVRGVPHLTILDPNGEIVNNDGVDIIDEYGVEGYPFTQERIIELKEQQEAAKKEESLRSILVSRSRDFLVSNDGKKVPVSDLEGKTVGLYFSMSSYNSCLEFTPILFDVYKILKGRGESFEVVLVSLDDDDEESYKEDFDIMPWLALPYEDKSRDKLARYFNVINLPTLVIIGPDGKTINFNAAEVVENHGIHAFPFTKARVEELAVIEKAKLGAQTLESLLVLGDLDFLIKNDGTQIPVSELIENNIVLYFSAEWCAPCRAFMPKLIKTYNEIKEKDDGFEIIFVSSDHDKASFDELFSTMPWLAIPFGDERKKSLKKKFKVYSIPTAIAIGPTGQTVAKDAKELIMVHGTEAYPFTEERMKEIELQLEEIAKDWPKKLKHRLHEEHELILTRRLLYTCDECEEEGNGWSYHCEECYCDLHPKCVLEEVEESKKKVMEVNVDNGLDDSSEEEEEWVCDGEVCYRVSKA
ncbi:probable nucleoredoxin 1 [Telopea speciosissima]|uniref:probable nucleoredoxin 1 n=1 Tax=Telopea speciosissima TaxID=54955 RepID=UPI001CC40CE3|nr:probable nucleoredoxin 1 [Telopea speciosissima]